jgi:hypothetical protein
VSTRHTQPVDQCRGCLPGAIGRRSEPPRGHCPTCGHVYRLTSTGLVWTHNNHVRDTQSGSYLMRCSGAGKPPKGQP